MQPSSISAVICVRIGTEAAPLKANWFGLVMNCGSSRELGAANNEDAVYAPWGFQGNGLRMSLASTVGAAVLLGMKCHLARCIRNGGKLRRQI